MENKEVTTLNIQLNVDQVSVILTTLGKLPYETIAPLVQSIRFQANQQLEKLNSETPAE